MTAPRIVGVIPARYDSTRFKGKVLADLLGKPMIQHVYERARRSHRLDDVLIACDSELIVQKAKEFGATAVLTAATHESGSDRIAEAVRSLKADIVINIQGDEPLIDPQAIDLLAGEISADPDCLMATLIKIIDRPEDLTDSNVVKVVVDQHRNALYFSRAPIPFDRERKGLSPEGYYRHLGIYAYRKEFLTMFIRLPKSRLERIEQLEQLRVLEAGYKIKTVVTDSESMGVDTPGDLARVEEFLKKKAGHG